MQLHNATVLIAGANRGIGLAFVRDALEAGAEEVLGDELTQQVKRGLSAEPGIYLRDARA